MDEILSKADDLFGSGLPFVLQLKNGTKLSASSLVGISVGTSTYVGATVSIEIDGEVREVLLEDISDILLPVSDV